MLEPADKKVSFQNSFHLLAKSFFNNITDSITYVLLLIYCLSAIGL